MSQELLELQESSLCPHWLRNGVLLEPVIENALELLDRGVHLRFTAFLQYLPDVHLAATLLVTTPHNTPTRSRTDLDDIFRNKGNALIPDGCQLVHRFVD